MLTWTFVGQLHTSIYDKRYDFNSHISNFPFRNSNIPSSPVYGVYTSQFIRYARTCFSYECFILRARRLSSKLLKQGYRVEHLKSSFSWKFYGRYGILFSNMRFPSRILYDILTLYQQWLPNQSDFPPIPWPWYRLWPSPNLGKCLCSNCWDRFLELVMSFLDFSPQITLGTFSILLCPSR